MAEWPPHADEPTGYWLSNLPAGTPISELVRPAKIRWRAGHDYRELKTGLGLDHFEGRSWTGWHRHVTLAVLAQAFITLLRSDPKVTGALRGRRDGVKISRAAGWLRAGVAAALRRGPAGLCGFAARGAGAGGGCGGAAVR